MRVILVFLLLLVVNVHFNVINRRLPLPSNELDDDEDVAEERERVLSGEADDDLVCLKNLTKVNL